MILDFFCLSGDSLSSVAGQLGDLENSFIYPFGNDNFTINHGKNYFDFFKLLGEVFCFGYRVDKKIIASVICVLRQLNNELVWYLADLKVYSKIKDLNLVVKLKQDISVFLYNKTNKFYAISMNSAEKQNGRIAKILNRNLPTAVKYTNDIAIYLVDITKFIFCKNNLFTNYQTVSLQGKKDLILQSTKTRIPLIHIKLKYGASEVNTNNNYLKPYNKFMFCTLINSALQQKLTWHNIYPVATAAIIHSEMQNYNWQFINTCEL